MKNILKTVIALLFASTIVSCEWEGLKKEDSLPAKNTEVILNSDSGSELPPKP